MLRRMRPPKAFATARRSAKSMTPSRFAASSNGQLTCTNESGRRRTTFETADIVFPASNGPSRAPTGKCGLRSRPRVSVMNDKVDGPNTRFSITDQEALQFAWPGRPGELKIMPTKPMATQRDLSLAYSPGVAVPVKAIAADPSAAYDYTTRGNMVAVITNGTAILGLGNLGALASKPVMEGKAVLFKRFADVDSIDLEVGTEDPDEFVNAVKYLGPSFGGINLEDIKA